MSPKQWWEDHLANVQRMIELREQAEAANRTQISADQAKQVEASLRRCKRGISDARRALRDAYPMMLDVTGMGEEDLDKLRRSLDRTTEAMLRAQATWLRVNPYRSGD